MNVYIAGAIDCSTPELSLGAGNEQGNEERNEPKPTPHKCLPEKADCKTIS
jgi:hypothetical protein